MLTYLHVKNIALIEELEIDFDYGLNILTGETGAGKSIILGSINYVLGAKVKKDFIRSGAKEAFVECVFDMKSNQLDRVAMKNLLSGYGISLDDEGVIISRKTALNGRSVFRVNGEVVKQDVIKSLASFLIDIHSQHEHQSLLSNSRQLDLLDRYAGIKMEQLLQEFSQKYKEFQKLNNSINDELLDDDKRRREIAFLEFEIDEIKKASLEKGEDIELQKTHDRLSHSQLILDKLSKVNNELYTHTDIGFVISSALGELDKLVVFDEELEPVVENLTQIEDLLGSLKRDMTRYLESMDDFEEELFYAEKRLDLINQIKLKYGNTIDDVFAYLEIKQSEHSSLIDFEKNLQQTKASIKKMKNELVTLSVDIHKLRKSKAKELSKDIQSSLVDLNLENARFEVNVSSVEDFTPKGMDKVMFLISTNRGEDVKPLKEVASGGELSRVMLAIKSILAEVDGVDTLVFDEIDTGISGVTAQKVAEKMARLSNERQLICITHLPQIAAMARAHFLIHKKDIDETTLTYVDPLDEGASVKELARMLSGAVTSDIVLANAKEMKDYAMEIIH